MTQQPFARRAKVKESFVRRDTEQVADDDEPPLNRRRLTPEERVALLVAVRRARMGLCISSRWAMVVMSIFVFFAGFVGVGLIGVAFLESEPMSVSAYRETITARPTLPPTITDTPTMTPAPQPTPTPTRTRLPTATPTSFINVLAQQITQEYPYGWYSEMKGETEYNKELCTHVVNLEFCDYGFSTVNLSPYTGPGLEPYPQRFVVFFMWHGYARWWSELMDGKGEPFRIGRGLPFTRAELEQGVCVPVLWNIVASPTLKRLNGRIGYQVRRAFLGEAGVSELPEEVSGIPTALQLEIFDKPPEGCNVVTEGFPSEYLPEYLRIEQ